MKLSPICTLERVSAAILCLVLMYYNTISASSSCSNLKIFLMIGTASGLLQCYLFKM